jgi:quinol monooxygenase YgiN
MIAILAADPGRADALRELMVEIGIHVREEVGCLTFAVYRALDVEGRFYEHLNIVVRVLTPHPAT